MICPLCLSSESELFDQDKERSYLKCSVCDLVFVPRSSLISVLQEKERYNAHENSEENEGYKKYLSKIAEKIKDYLAPGNMGLDFGCGKTQLLENLLAPFEVCSYDLFFHPQEKVFDNKYDFIILSEVIEHLRDPRETMLKLRNHLLPDGKIFIKTKIRPLTGQEFSKWFYKRDATHIQFFNAKSFNELKKICQIEEIEEIGEDLFLFRE